MSEYKQGKHQKIFSSYPALNILDFIGDYLETGF